MPRTGDAMLLAPPPDGVGVCRGEPLGEMLIIAVARRREALVGKIPENLRQGFEEIRIPPPPVTLREIIRVADGENVLFLCKRGQFREYQLRLIRENGRNHLAEFLTEALPIELMGQAQEFFNCLRVQHIHIRRVVEARLRRLYHTPAPDFARSCRRLVIRIAPVIFQKLSDLVLTDDVRLEKILPLRRNGARLKPYFEMARLVRRLTGHHAACRPARPAVLIVQVSKEPLLPGLIDAGADAVHKLLGEIGGLQPYPGMHEETTHPHLLEDADLTPQFLRLQPAVPRPERSILEGGIRTLEQ